MVSFIGIIVSIIFIIKKKYFGVFLLLYFLSHILRQSFFISHKLGVLFSAVSMVMLCVVAFCLVNMSKEVKK